MKIELKNGMKFQSITGRDGEFTIRKYDYYGDNNPIWCAFTDNSIYPLDEIVLSDYIPNVDGLWINEENDYIY